jgi:hypothetical protein
MSKRILIVVVAVVAAFLASGFVGVTNSEGFRGGGFWHRNIPINWKVSGTIVGLQLASPSPDGYSGPGLMIDAFLKGAPGKAQFRVLAASTSPPEFIPECFGPGQYFDFDDMVVTFEDLSMLFAKQDPDNPGWNCFTEEPAVANMVITGGTGKYKDAQGQYQGIFDGTTVGDSGALIAETGTIKGWIER